MFCEGDLLIRVFLYIANTGTASKTAETASDVAAALGGASVSAATNRIDTIKGGGDSFAAASMQDVAPAVAQAVNSALEQRLRASKVWISIMYHSKGISY